jgi:DNA-binding response OmpR family regulator
LSQHVASDTHILLVEDDDIARVSLSQVLAKAGYRVETVPDGETAVSRLDRPDGSQPYDLVISDLMLREIDGLQVLKRARQLADPPQVILLTGFGTLQTAIEALRNGASDYLLKPCKPEELLRCVRAVAQRRAEHRTQQEALEIIASGLAQLQGYVEPAQRGGAGPATGQLLTAGSLLIDTQNHAVFFQGTPVTLTPTEYAIVCCLAESVGRMVTYSELARQVYRQSVGEADAHTLLKTHIHNLRRKLAPELIVNVRSTGYRLALAPGG